MTKFDRWEKEEYYKRYEAIKLRAEQRKRNLIIGICCVVIFLIMFWYSL